MNRVAIPFVLAFALAGLTGCKSMPEQLQGNLVEAFESDPSNAMILCGYAVQGVTGVTVTNVTNQGSSSSGTGTAQITATPIPIPGMPAAGQCAGQIMFRYDQVTTGRTVRYDSRGRRRVSTSSERRIWAVSVVSRPQMQMAPGMPGAVPAAMPGAMPAQ